MRLRPEMFDAEDQASAEEINREIKKTAFLLVLGFSATSAFRMFQIKSQNRDIVLGLTAIVASYSPAYAFYSY